MHGYEQILTLIVVYDTSGQFVTSFGRFGPNGITSCTDGFIYACDSMNDKIWIF